MFVRMNSTATPEQLNAVRDRAVAAGLSVYEEHGAAGTTLAVLGPAGISAARRASPFTTCAMPPMRTRPCRTPS